MPDEPQPPPSPPSPRRPERRRRSTDPDPWPAPVDAQWMTHLPVWVRAISVFGVTGAIALFLVYIGATQVPGIRTELTALREENRQTREVLQQQVNEIRALTRAIDRLCATVAKDDSARDRCFAIK
jgi:hypothetical protein